MSPPLPSHPVLSPRRLLCSGPLPSRLTPCCLPAGCCAPAPSPPVSPRAVSRQAAVLRPGAPGRPDGGAVRARVPDATRAAGGDGPTLLHGQVQCCRGGCGRAWFSSVCIQGWVRTTTTDGALATRGSPSRVCRAGNGSWSSLGDRSAHAAACPVRCICMH